MLSYKNWVVLSLLVQRWAGDGIALARVIGPLLARVPSALLILFTGMFPILTLGAVLDSRLEHLPVPATLRLPFNVGLLLGCLALWVVGTGTFWVRYWRNTAPSHRAALADRWTCVLPEETADRRAVAMVRLLGLITVLGCALIPIVITLFLTMGICQVRRCRGLVRGLIQAPGAVRRASGRGWRTYVQGVLDEHPEARVRIEQHALRGAIDPVDAQVLERTTPTARKRL